jgi:uncharacterized membrane protein
MIEATKSRISSIDFLRGVALVLMTFGHVRYFFHSSAFYFLPTNIDLTSIPIFFARWIPNFCPPIFCFLAGVSIFFIGRSKTKLELSEFLVKRGLWLIFIDLSVVTFAWHFDIHFNIVTFSVIAALGVSMLFLAVLVYLPRVWILVFSILVIFFHNLLDTIAIYNSVWWGLVHQVSSFSVTNNLIFEIEYPFLPWLAVMALGYSFGFLYSHTFDSPRRRKILYVSGASSVFLFGVLRAVNEYGDPSLWKEYGNISQTVMSFLNLSKYPPSLLYLLLTLGVTFIILASSEPLKGRAVIFLSTFGKTPFLYYIVHLYLVHILALVYAQITGFGWQSMILKQWVTSNKELQGYGVGLISVFVIWLIVVSMMYPLCKLFVYYKSKNKGAWWL